MSKEAHRVLRSMLDPWVDKISEIGERRHKHHALLSKLLEDCGCRPTFPVELRHLPGVFMFDVPAQHDLPALKKALYGAGVECSVFYTRQSFFVPVHQALSVQDVEYIASCVRAGLAGQLSNPI